MDNATRAALRINRAKRAQAMADRGESRSLCAVCGRKVALLRGGDLASHGVNGDKCTGRYPAHIEVKGGER